MNRVLVVDDDIKIARIVAKYLASAGYEAMEAHNCEQALHVLTDHPISLLVLDVMLPDLSGLELCSKLRDAAPGSFATPSDIPVLMLSALGLTDDIIAGLRLGADDYMVKPFEPRELVERVGALLRRYGRGVVRKPRKRLGNLEIDQAGEAVFCQGEPIGLTRREYALLNCFCENPMNVLSRQQLLDLVWGWDYEGSERAVDLCVLRLRSKLEEAGVSGVLIETVWGSGYKLVQKEQGR